MRNIYGDAVHTNALSFYRSQNVLGWSKFFVPDQKYIYILWQSQTFCARQKDDLHSVKLVFEETLMPCPFTGPKMFCAGPNFLSQPKNLTAFSASSKTFVPAQKTILLNANHLFVWHKMSVTSTICK